jgi:hypothetical protein
MSDNPYQAPAVMEVAAETGAEEIRTRHIKHEASIKAVGFLYLIGGVILAFSLIGLGASFARLSSQIGGDGGSGALGGLGAQEMLMMGLFLVMGVLQFVAGWGLRKLRSWAKIPAALLAAVSLLSIPIGTLIGIYILYLLFSEKGKTVLSPAYQDIIAQTPHIKYRTPKWIWILLLVVVLLIAGLAALAFFGTKV